MWQTERKVSILLWVTIWPNREFKPLYSGYRICENVTQLKTRKRVATTHKLHIFIHTHIHIYMYMCAGKHKYICQYKEVIPQSRSDILGAVELFSKHTHKLIINVFGPRAAKVSVMRGCACVCFTSQPELQKKKEKFNRWNFRQNSPKRFACCCFCCSFRGCGTADCPRPHAEHVGLFGLKLRTCTPGHLPTEKKTRVLWA